MSLKACPKSLTVEEVQPSDSQFFFSARLSACALATENSILKIYGWQQNKNSMHSTLRWLLVILDVMHKQHTSSIRSAEHHSSSRRLCACMKNEKALDEPISSSVIYAIKPLRSSLSLLPLQARMMIGCLQRCQVRTMNEGNFEGSFLLFDTGLMKTSRLDAFS